MRWQVPRTGGNLYFSAALSLSRNLAKQVCCGSTCERFIVSISRPLLPSKQARRCAAANYGQGQERTLQQRWVRNRRAAKPGTNLVERGRNAAEIGFDFRCAQSDQSPRQHSAPNRRAASSGDSKTRGKPCYLGPIKKPGGPRWMRNTYCVSAPVCWAFSL